MKKTCISILIVALVLLLLFGLSCLSGLIVMLLWNFVMPIFGVTTLTFWQSWGVNLLLSAIGGKFYSRQTSIDKIKECLTSIKNKKEIKKEEKDVNIKVEIDVNAPDNSTVTAEVNKEKLAPSNEQEETPKPKKSKSRRKKKNKEEVKSETKSE